MTPPPPRGQVVIADVVCPKHMFSAALLSQSPKSLGTIKELPKPVPESGLWIGLEGN